MARAAVTRGRSLAQLACIGAGRSAVPILAVVLPSAGECRFVRVAAAFMMPRGQRCVGLLLGC
jgi:hypothetical protein